MKSAMALVSANVAVFVLLKAVWAFAPGAVDGLMALLATPSGPGAVSYTHLTLPTTERV